MECHSQCYKMRKVIWRSLEGVQERDRKETTVSAGVNHNKQLLLFQFIFNITHFYDFTEVLLWWLLGTISSTEDRNIWPLCLKGFFSTLYSTLYFACKQFPPVPIFLLFHRCSGFVCHPKLDTVQPIAWIATHAGVWILFCFKSIH